MGGGATTVTDEGGFFWLHLSLQRSVPDHVVIRAAGADDARTVPVLAAENAQFGVISDIDDTIMRTGAYFLINNLWTSATGNVHEREVFDDARVLLQHYAQEKACFFYVSSSPWNLYDYLQAVFRKADLPLGDCQLADAPEAV